MPTVPERFKPRDDWSTEDNERWLKDSSYRPETVEYRQARREVLERHGFEPEAEEIPADQNEWTAAQHLDRLRGAR